MPAKEKVVTTLSMESNHFSTLLSMDTSYMPHDEIEDELNLGFSPPDINIPLLDAPTPFPGPEDLYLDVGLCPQPFESDVNGNNGTKIGKKCAKRLDSVWGAWFFFNFYFKPVLNDKSKGSNGVRQTKGVVSGFEKSDLNSEVFIVQHDLENMYMWVFKERPENALGKMQLRNYMNGHSRQGQRPFPFSADKGFIRSHKMQRKHYRGLSNPQCVHGIEIVRSPNLTGINEDELKKWMELTGRDLNFSIPLEATDFESWRNSPPTTELDPKRLINGSSLNLNGEGGLDMLAVCNKRKKNVDDEICLLSNDNNNCSNSDKITDSSPSHQVEPSWLSECHGVMRCAYGPVTAAKTIYEDEEGFLIIVSMPFADLKRVKVTWRNTISHGIVKISCVSTGCAPVIKRQKRAFKLTDPAPEHCPPGEFVREIILHSRIPEDAKLEAFGDESGTMLEILVPKHRVGPEEHEVRVCLRPSPWSE
ncbi:unnamed protein product [Cuscuta europaea]|uniref:HSP20-like chaperones superfamily protein n=1 Tax=Cuscuta europaea TaxID=41803 RepID=A0A9P0ZV35_CUSEU|nr:unnamed protein product [Cuscuta europaea]